jgi:hypothetical protein
MWVDGKYGKALEFDDGEDYFEVETSEAFGLEKVSATFWMYPYVAGASGGGSCIPVSNIVKATSLDWGFEWWNGGIFDWTLWPIGDKKTMTTVTEVEKWIFVAGTYDGTTTGLYIDGELKASNKFPGLSNPGPRPFYVAGNTCGVGWGCTNGWYNGIIDEVTVFKRSLSQKEVTEIMNGALSGASVELYGKLTVTWGKLKFIQ